MKTRNNIIQKLSGTTWGASASTLPSSELDLVFSTAKYCAPIWINNPHMQKVHSRLKSTMRIEAGAIRSTPPHWLPVLSHIPPPLTGVEHEERVRIWLNNDLPIHLDTGEANHNRILQKTANKNGENGYRSRVTSCRLGQTNGTAHERN